MWDELPRLLADFPSVVLTGLDNQDLPASVRVTPAVDHAARTLHGPLAPGLTLRPGPGSLLCHSHDDTLWSLRSILVRGTLELGGDRWTLHPSTLTRGQGFGGPLGDARTFLAARRRAAAYLARRGLTAPPIPWEEVRRAHRAARHR